MPGMNSICLALIVKNAEDTISRCIASALPYIDRWLIIDTGSTDNTKQVILDALEGVPGELRESPWVDFATNRTEMLKAASKSGAEYILMLDADLTVEVDGPFPPLTADEIHLTLLDRGLAYSLPLLTRASKPFFYAGVAHACLNCDEPVSIAALPNVRIIDHGGGPGKDGKFERDLAALQAQVVKKPADTRSWFYLAQTYRDLDMYEEAIECYLHRASMGGPDEEVYYSKFQAGTLTCEHRDFVEGVKLLLEAWQGRPNRAEALRAIAGVTTNIANRLPFPSDRLFVDRGAHSPYRVAPIGDAPMPGALPAIHIAIQADAIAPGKLRRRPRVTKKRGLNPADVSAVIVTRGNVDLAPILASLPYPDVVVWNNEVMTGQIGIDVKVFGRYMAIPLTKNPVIYWQDDDIVFTAHDELLAAYEPGQVICNMDQSWIDGAGYGDFLGMVGAGSLCDAGLPAQVFARYLAEHPSDDDLLVECDFAFGVLAPFKRVDLGYLPRSFTDDPDRLYQQPGQQERKWEMIRRARRMLLTEQRGLGTDGWCGCDVWLTPKSPLPYPACPHDIRGPEGEPGPVGLPSSADAAGLTLKAA